ncbi:MAG TPA: exonuclease SbcCD subunit D [Arthrobacter sp.]
MRLLHTSDWHLGRSFHGVGMLDAQRSFIDQLVSAVTENAVDVVLIAGDVYDRALPGVDVVGLLDDALVRLTGAGAKVVLTSGNHDSAIRLGFASRLLERGGVHLRTRLAELDQPLLLPLDGTDAADAGAEGAMLAIYGIPWLEPRLVAEQLGVATASHFEVTRAATELIRADLQRRSAQGIVHSVVLAHTFASGGISSDSERDLSIGGVGAVPLDLFDGFSYTALGHLHGRQSLSPQVRYSGSPLAYSFSEAKHQKGGWLIDVGPAGVASVTELAWDAPRKLAVLRGGITELLESSDHAWAEDAYCQITLTDAQRPAQAMERLRSRFPDTLVLGFDPQGGAVKSVSSYSSRLAEAEDDLSVCCGFLGHVRGREPDDAERAALAAALDNVRLQEASL